MARYPVRRRLRRAYLGFDPLGTMALERHIEHRIHTLDNGAVTARSAGP